MMTDVRAAFGIAIFYGAIEAARLVQRMQQDPLSVFDLITGENVFMVLGVLIILGAGRWFHNEGWPWFTRYKERQAELEHEQRLKQFDIEAESDKRWQDVTGRMTLTFADLKEELGAFRAVQQQYASSVELLIELMLKRNGGTGGMPKEPPEKGN